LLLLGFLAIHSILFRGVLTQGSVANTVTRQIGEYLRGRTSQSIMLEPIGYIGFYSNTPKVYDLGGLVSPEVLALRQSGRDGWFAEAVKMFRPEFVVLRRNEIENNLGWNVGTLFGSPEQRDWWEAHYLAEVNIGKGTSPLANFTIYRRRD
jgi:hypothetical protein